MEIDYKKLYEEALERARKFTIPDAVEALKYVFPELAESEDERVRKELLEHCINRRDGKQVCVDAGDYRRWADWLEKQGEKSNSVYDEELSEMLGSIIRRYINDPNIPYTEREKVSMEIIPYVERLEKQGEQNNIVQQLTAFAQHLQKRGAFRDDLCMDFEHEAQSFVESQNYKQSIR